MEDQIKGKVVVITGASSGIGESTARHLAQRGAKLVLAARRIELLNKLVSEIKSEGGEAIAVRTDVTSASDVKKLSEQAVAAFGRIDVLINNAGLMALAPLELGKIDEWNSMIDINIKGVLNGIAAVLPQMKEQQAGHIINMSSVVGHKVFTPIGTVYSATKFAVRVISEGLRSEAPAGVRTTIISPGAVETELVKGTSVPEVAVGVKEFYEANQIKPDAVARAIVYAIEQPADVDINEILIRPTLQEF